MESNEDTNIESCEDKNDENPLQGLKLIANIDYLKDKLLLSKLLYILYETKNNDNKYLYAKEFIIKCITENIKCCKEYKIDICRIIFDFYIICPFLLNKREIFHLYNKLIQFCNYFPNDTHNIWISYFNYIFNDKYSKDLKPIQYYFENHPQNQFQYYLENYDKFEFSANINKKYFLSLLIPRPKLKLACRNLKDHRDLIDSPLMKIIQELVNLNKHIPKEEDAIENEEVKYPDPENDIEIKNIPIKIRTIDIYGIQNENENKNKNERLLWNLEDINNNISNINNFEYDHKDTFILKTIFPKNYTILLNNIKFPQLPKNIEEFKIRFQQNKITNVLSDFDFKNNFIMIGNLLSNILLNQTNNNNSNIYLYFYNLDLKLNIVLSDAERLRQHLITKWGCENLQIFVSQYCIRFLNIKNNNQINLSLCKYSSIADVLNDIDLGSSSVAWDNNGHLLFNANGKFAYENGLNYIDANIRRRANYEIRLQKSINNGFGIILSTSSLLVVDQSNDGINTEKIFNIHKLKINLIHDKSLNWSMNRIRDTIINNINEDNLFKNHYHHYFKNITKLQSGNIKNLIGIINNKNFISFEETRMRILPENRILSEYLKEYLMTNGLENVLKIFKYDTSCCMKIINSQLFNKSIDWDELLINSHINLNLPFPISSLQLFSPKLIKKLQMK